MKVFLASALLSMTAATANPAAINIVGDAIVTPLTTTPGDTARGAAIVANRQIGLCVLCHQLPSDNKSQGNIATSIAGAGSRWSAAQLRLRLVDSRRLDPASVMPAYHRVDGLTRVANAYQGKSILDAQQIEDVVAYLVTLK